MLVSSSLQNSFKIVISPLFLFYLFRYGCWNMRIFVGFSLNYFGDMHIPTVTVILFEGISFVFLLYNYHLITFCLFTFLDNTFTITQSNLKTNLKICLKVVTKSTKLSLKP